jgi:ribosome maturation factor RimP
LDTLWRQRDNCPDNQPGNDLHSFKTPLRHEADYRRFSGRLAKIVTSEAVEGQTSFAGRLSGFEEGDILLTEGRRVHRVPLGKVRRARLEVEF